MVWFRRGVLFTGSESVEHEAKDMVDTRWRVFLHGDEAEWHDEDVANDQVGDGRILCYLIKNL